MEHGIALSRVIVMIFQSYKKNIININYLIYIKKITLLILCIIFPILVDAQALLNVQYLRNGVNNQFQISDISSDYGMRNVGNGATNFHRGIDYGHHVAGDAVVSLEDGTITRIRIGNNNLKYIVVSIFIFLIITCLVLAEYLGLLMIMEG
jgi:hypothetical protein